jgi:hypothetical protein
MTSYHAWIEILHYVQNDSSFNVGKREEGGGVSDVLPPFSPCLR